jgi:hypothetical protein
LLDTLETAGADQERPQIPAWLCVSAERVGAVAIRAIRHNRGLVVISPTLRVLWWLTRISPALAEWIVRQGWRRRGPPDIS